MRNDNDVVVIGSGLGGLAAAAKLSRAGLGVRVLERHVQPGGYATTFSRPPFEFEVSLHALTGIGPPSHRGSLWTMLEDLGVHNRLSFHPIEGFYRTIAGNLDLRIPHGRQAALAAFIDAFPRERRGLERLMDRMFAIRDELAQMNARGSTPSVLATIARYPLLAHAAAAPLGSVLHRELTDPLARLAFAQIYGYFGLPPSELALIYFSACFTSILLYGACYPEGKSQALSNAFVAAIEESGGTVTLGNGAQKILVRDGKVEGVIADDGEHIRTTTVVSNANPITTIWELVGAEHFPRAFLERVDSATPSVSIFTVYLGLSRTAVELGMRDHETFISGTVDLDRQYASAFSLEPPDSFCVTAYNATDPRFSPAGTSVVSLSCLVDGNTWAKVPAADYAELKQRWTLRLVEQAARHFPGLRESIQVALASTPLTLMRYTGNVAGAIYGFAVTPAQNPAFRLEPKAPIDGLWFAGAWTQPGGGYEPVISSGYGTAQAVLAQLGIQAADASAAAG